jgi:hypothetical protein
MTYVASRLGALPHAHIIPWNQNGLYLLKDYEEILEILDKAFGDPNRVANARKDLFALHQKNQEFSLFYAEFQRLAMDGNMPEDSLKTILEQAVSRELQGQLAAVSALLSPDQSYTEFVHLLQKLENSRRYHLPHQYSVPKTYASVLKPAPVTTRPVQLTPRSTLPTLSTAPPNTVQTGPGNPDAMDLSAQRSPRPGATRKERGECFRCGATSHLVRDCSLPDTRPVRMGSTTQSRSSVPSSNTSRSPSPSVNGMSLE